MPWIKEDECSGCGQCIMNCPVNAIYKDEGVAVINMDQCIRCGQCHDICQFDAVKHDSEKIPEEVKENIEWVKELMRNYYSDQEKQGFLKRMKNHFNKEKTVIEKTLDKIDSMEI